MHSLLRLLNILFLIAFLSAPASAAAATGSDDARRHFAAGAEAANLGQYEAALAAFLAARDAGLDGPAVHFNIGVCAWELGRLDLAEQAFSAAARAPGFAPLAHYNLGLVAQRRGDDGAAADWFRLAAAGAEDDDLGSLATAALAALGEQPPPARAVRRSRVFLTAQAGYDDNVALLADGELAGVSGDDSPFIELLLAVATPLARDLWIEAGGFLTRYSDLNDFNQDGLQLDLVYRPRLGDWRGEIGAGYGLGRLDGATFEDRWQVLLGASRPLAEDWTLRLRYRFENINGRAPFEGLTGERHEASIRAQRWHAGELWRLEYRLELNDRDSEALSPDRHRLEAGWQKPVAAGLDALLEIGWRHGRYDIEDARRSERRLTAAAGVSGKLGRRWEWLVRYDWTRNTAALPEFEYSRNRISAGVQAFF